MYQVVVIWLEDHKTNLKIFFTRVDKPCARMNAYAWIVLSKVCAKNIFINKFEFFDPKNYYLN